MGKMTITMISTILMISSIAGIIGMEDEPASAEPTRGDLSDPLDLTLNSFDDLLEPGVVESFYVSLYNDYDGSGFQRSSSPMNITELKEVKITIVSIVDEDMDVVDPQPVTWTFMEAYNNNGDGYTFERYNSVNFFGDSGSSYFSFTINTEDILPGDYQIRIDVDFRYQIDWDGGTSYDWARTVRSYYTPFTIRSSIGISGYPNYPFRAFSESLNYDSLYSGAEKKLFGFEYPYSNSGTISDITAMISFPGSGITVDQSQISSPTLPNHLVWRITIPFDTLPGEHELLLQLSYRDDGVQVNEMSTIQTFTIGFTPMIFAPQSDDLNDPFLTFSRSSLPDSLTVPFRNGGNVELHQVTIRLDLDNTRYIDGTSYYINEDSNGNDYQEGIEVEFESIPVDGTVQVAFETVNFLPRLPPGIYKVPVDYMGYYTDDGSTGGSPREVMTGGWNDIGLYDHRTIMRNTVYPEDKNSDFYQYILIRILDDPEGPLLSGYIDSGYNQYPGTVNAYMRLRIENYEMYEFKNLIYHIHTDMGSPFTRPNSNSNDSGFTTLEPILRAGLYESSSYNTQSDSFYFYANIREDAAPGINYFYVDIEGQNEYNQPFNKTILAYITIRSNQPRFEVLSVEVGDLLEDRSVAVTVDVINVGLGGARNLTVFFKSSNTGYNGVDAPSEVGNVVREGTFSYTFHFKPESETRYFNGNYNGYLYFSYYDDLGDFEELMSGNSLYVKFDIYDKLPDLKIIKVDAPLVDRGDTFEVQVTVMNVGGSATNGLKVMIPYNSAQFSILTGIQEISDLEPNETILITFRIKAASEISDGTTYSFTVYFSYTDILGRERLFSDAETDSFSVRIKDRVIPSEQRQVVEDDGVIVSAGAGSVILGIFILFAAIIFGGIIVGGARELYSGKPVTERKTASPRPVAKKLEFDDEEEEEEMDEEDEEEEEEADEESEDW